jgi:hypothetical protein
MASALSENKFRPPKWNAASKNASGNGPRRVADEELHLRRGTLACRRKHSLAADGEHLRREVLEKERAGRPDRARDPDRIATGAAARLENPVPWF